MSHYTTELRWVIDYYCGDNPPATIAERIYKASSYIFNFEYPIWKDTDKVQLEYMILQKYYLREIAFETVALWQFYLEQKMCEIMPYYVDLWQTTQEKYNFLEPYSFSETYTDSGTNNRSIQATTGETSQQDNTSQANRSGEDNRTIQRDTSGENDESATGSQNLKENTTSIGSDFPQATFVSNRDYASTSTETGRTSNNSDTGTVKRTYSDSEAVEDKNTSAGTEALTGHVEGKLNRTMDTTDTTNLSNQHTITRSGNIGGHTYSELLKQYRESILKIPPLIVKDLAPLFFTLY